jgi:hypothetical protein
MPATLSAIPCPELAAVDAARPLQAAQVVVPSVIAVPHILQKAIAVSSRRDAPRRSFTLGLAKERCGKVPESAIGSNRQFAMWK